MADLRWFLRRLRAMSVPEILWRVEQRARQMMEDRGARDRRPVTEAAFARGSDGGESFLPDRLHLNLGNRTYSLHTAISLPYPYRYGDYRTRWHAGFQTDRSWPMVPSSKLDYRGMDAVGDARTNWELNKHFQFALLAKDFRASGDKRYLEELAALFRDWNEKNPFLWGISWTSGIEIAERTMNWCYALGFLWGMEGVPEELLGGLRRGIANMGAWLSHHDSRYSSANNHRVIEVSGLLHAGVLLGNRAWIRRAVGILSRELVLQNHTDGVNKEEALYYQAFLMEAYAMDLRLLKANQLYPQETEGWISQLMRMSRYLRACQGDHREVVAFGDDDGGKLLDLEGCGEGLDPALPSGAESSAYYRYVLQFMGLLLPERYPLPWGGSGTCENLRWLFSEEELRRARDKAPYMPKGSMDFPKGGNAVLRSADGEILIGIDHAPLGYGALCAHGHADALSFVAYVRGELLFADPGTYIYHTDEEARNEFRRTRRHNTVSLGDRDQSEMLGPFLWGRKAACRLIRADLGDKEDVIEAEQDGYAPYLHRRRFVFDKRKGRLTVTDTTGGAEDAVFHLLLGTGVEADLLGPRVVRCRKRGSGEALAEIRFPDGYREVELVAREISLAYGSRMDTLGVDARIVSEPAVCVIQFLMGRPS